MALDTVAARSKRRRLPTVDVPRVQDDELRRSIEALKEHVRMYEGDSGAPKERFVTIKELELAGVIGTKVQGNFALIDSVLGNSVSQGQQGGSQTVIIENTTVTPGDGVGATSLNELTDVNVAGAGAGNFLRLVGGFWVGQNLAALNVNWTTLQTFNACLRIAGIDSGYVDFCHDNTDLNITGNATTDVNLIGLNVNFETGQAIEWADVEYVTVTESVGPSSNWGTDPNTDWTYDSIPWSTATLESTGILQWSTSPSTGLNALDVSPDGLNVIIADTGKDFIRTASLSTAYDFSSATSTGASWAFTNPSGCARFIDDGNKVLVFATSAGRFYVHATASPYVINGSPGAALSEVRHQDLGYPNFLGKTGWLTADGVYFYTSGDHTSGYDVIMRHTLTTPFDLSTYSAQQIIWNSGPSALANSPNGYLNDVRVTPDGVTMLAMNGSRIWIGQMSTPFDLSTMVWSTAGSRYVFDDTADSASWYQAIVTTDGNALYVWDTGGSDGRFAKYTKTVSNPPTAAGAFYLGDSGIETFIDGSTTNITGAAQLDSTLNVDGASTLRSTTIGNTDLTSNMANFYSGTTLFSSFTGSATWAITGVDLHFPSGKYTRWTGATNYMDASHDDTDMNFTLNTSGQFNFSHGLFVDALGSNTDPGADNARFDGYGMMTNRTTSYITNFNAAGEIEVHLEAIHGGNRNFLFSTVGNRNEATLDVAGDLTIEAGNSLFLYGLAGVNNVEFVHDDTDFNTTFTSTTDWNITGVTTVSFYSLGTTGGLSVGRGATQALTINVTDGVVTQTYVQDETDATNHSMWWNIDSAGTGLKSYSFRVGNVEKVGWDKDGNFTAQGTVAGSNLNVSNWDTAFGWGDHSTQNYAVTTGDNFSGALYMDSGAFFYVRNPTNTGFASLSHDASDFNLRFSSTTDFNIDFSSQLTGQVKVFADTHFVSGSEVQIRDSTNTKTLTASHGVNDFTFVGASTANISWSGFSGDFTIGNYIFSANQSLVGADNYVLTYDSVGGKISLEAAAGGGIGGSIADTQIAFGSGTDIAGSANLTWDGSGVDVTGTIDASGQVTGTNTTTGGAGGGDQGTFVASANLPSFVLYRPSGALNEKSWKIQNSSGNLQIATAADGGTTYSALQFYRAGSGFTCTQISATPTNRFEISGGGDFWLRDRGELVLYNSLDTSNVTMTWDALDTDFSITTSGSAPAGLFEITGFDDLVLTGGTALTIYDGADADSVSFSHDADDFNIVDNGSTRHVEWQGFAGYHWFSGYGLAIEIQTSAPYGHASYGLLWADSTVSSIETCRPRWGQTGAYLDTGVMFPTFKYESTTGTPALGEIRFNNATMTSVTEVRVSGSPNNWDAGFEVVLTKILAAGDRVHVVQPYAGDRHIIFEVTDAVVDSGSYATIPVVHVETGSFLTDNQTTVLYWERNEGRRLYKDADTSRNTTTTLADDDDLAGWNLEADTAYSIEGVLFMTSTSATPDFDWAFQVSQTPQASHIVYNGTAADDITTERTEDLAASTQAALHISGIIHTHATLASVLDLQWAQNVSDATNVTLQTGSWIKVTKLGAA